MDKQEFSEILKTARNSRGIGISELARRSGFSRRAIYNWELGEDNISLENADRILAALGVSASIGKGISVKTTDAAYNEAAE